jgi:hypothetical protein
MTIKVGNIQTTTDPRIGKPQTAWQQSVSMIGDAYAFAK